MMSTRPPGPWTVSETDDLSVDTDNPIWRTVVDGDGDGYEVASTYGQTAAEAKANAHLIAAAPELLSVADEVHALLYHYDLAQRPGGVDWGPVEMLREAILDKIRYALAKAEARHDER